MPRHPLQIALGLLLVAAGIYLVFSPLVVAEALGRPHATSPQMINLRASWGGTLAGLGAFVAWVPSLQPWPRAALGLLLASMAGIGLARATGFVIDGHPDTLQWVWITAEAALVAVSAIGLRAMARRAK
jgi:hypothetical protein